MRENAESELSFHTDRTASYSRQSNFTLYLLRDGQKVAYLDYVIFEGTPSISMIEVYREEDKRKGYGRMLVDQLAQEQGGYEQIEWGMMTPGGLALRNSMDKERGFDRAEHENKHYKYDEVLALIRAKSLTAAEFFVDAYALGDSGAFKKWDQRLAQLGYPLDIDGINLNDVGHIAEWTRGAADNKVDPRVEPPDYVQRLVAELSA